MPCRQSAPSIEDIELLAALPKILLHWFGRELARETCDRMMWYDCRRTKGRKLAGGTHRWPLKEKFEWRN
jgi:hypothetical protein